MKYLFIAACMFNFCACIQTKKVSEMEKINQNKLLVSSAYKRIFAQMDFNYADSIIADNYIQHNPMVKTGKQGFLEFLTMMQQMPKPEKPAKPFVRMFADDDFVVSHMSIEFMGKPKAVVDLFRIENGKLAEHWDAVQDNEVNSQGVDMVSGSVSIENVDQTESNKDIIKDFSSKLLDNEFVHELEKFANEHMVEHNGSEDVGLEGFKQVLLQRKTTQVHRIIAEGNFVLTQSEGVSGGKPMVYYDIYRLNQSKIVDHWLVEQEIPQQMAHNNGMI